MIRFGNRVLLTGTRLSCERSIEVGDHTGLSDARIMDTDFHAVESYGQPRYNTSGVSKAISIGSNVWVGAGAMILKGVKIGDNSVVGAGSVVASRVPANTVVFGNPARVIWRLKERLANVAVPQEARESMSWTSGSPPARAHVDMTQLARHRMKPESTWTSDGAKSSSNCARVFCDSHAKSWTRAS